MLRTVGYVILCTFLVASTATLERLNSEVSSCPKGASRCHEDEPEALALMQRARRYTQPSGDKTGKRVSSDLLQSQQGHSAVTLSWLAKANPVDMIQHFHDIQTWQSSASMRDYVAVLLRSAGGNADVGRINGMIPYYSGEIASQPWSRFWQEMAKEKLLPNGMEAHFTETGYWAIAVQKNHIEMMNYVKRLIQVDGGHLLDEWKLSGFVNYFSGEINVASLSQLRAELTTKGVSEGWVEFMPELIEAEFLSIQNKLNNTKMAQFIRKFLLCSGGSPPAPHIMTFVAQFYSGLRGWQKVDALWAEALKQDWLAHASSAAFTEAGYKSVAMRRNQKEMVDYIYRLVDFEGGQVKNLGNLYGVASYHDGEKGIQTFKMLKEDLRNKAETESWLEYASPGTGSFVEK